MECCDDQSELGWCEGTAVWVCNFSFYGETGLAQRSGHLWMRSCFFFAMTSLISSTTTIWLMYIQQARIWNVPVCLVVPLSIHTAALQMSDSILALPNIANMSNIEATWHSDIHCSRQLFWTLVKKPTSTCSILQLEQQTVLYWSLLYILEFAQYPIALRFVY